MDTEWEDAAATGIGDQLAPDAQGFLNELLTTVDDFLWMKQVDLKNTEPRPQDGGWDDEAVLYGKDYEELKSMLFDVMDRWNLT